MTLLKNNIIWCIWCNASIFTKPIVLKGSPALIGQLSSALRLAEYLKHETEMLCLLTVV